MKLITSLQNPFIKHLLHLREKSRERRQSGEFLIEGKREIRLAVKGGYELKSIVFCELDDDFHRELTGVEQMEVSREIYHKLAYRRTTEGAIALAKARKHRLEDLAFTSKRPLVLVAEAPEKPGNIGALLRTADAAGLDAFIIANSKTDPYNPNIIRSSLGGLFTVQMATGSTEDVITFLQQRGISIYCTALQASVPYTGVDYAGPTAIVVGTEADGLSNTWLRQAAQNIIIPMRGSADSMNVSVAAGVLIFEALRQRG